jgi:hypothetical protein
MADGLQTSEAVDQIAAALAKVLPKLTDVKAAQTANMGTYSIKYANLADAYKAVRSKLGAEGVMALQSVSGGPGHVSVSTLLLHTSGQWIAFGPFSLSGGGNAQAAGSAVTYARRYSLLAALGLATEDDDGKKASEKPPPLPVKDEHQAPPPAPADWRGKFILECKKAKLLPSEVCRHASDGARDDITDFADIERFALAQALRDLQV